VFVRIKAADPSRFLDGFDTLGIRDRGTGLRVSPLSFALSSVKDSKQERPGALETQATKMVEHRLPGRKIGWQIAPWATRAQDVEDRIENGT
jgi:hypothetical protein